jgi:soluble lytic murein transglycosylase-like protein
MSIDPADITSIITYVPKLYEVDNPSVADPAHEDAPLPTAPNNDIDAIEQRLSNMISDLTKQFAALASSFVRSVCDLAKNSRAAVAPAPSSQGGKFAATIANAAKRHELDPALLSAVVGQESGFHPRAVSGAGAMGLMQLMPETARALGVRDPFDPAQNVDGGAKYLRGLIDRFHGRLDFALAAYNAGPGTVDKFGGVPPYPETQAYVKNILASYRSAALAS